MLYYIVFIASIYSIYYKFSPVLQLLVQGQRDQFRYFLGKKEENIIKILFHLLPDKMISCIDRVQLDKKASCTRSNYYKFCPALQLLVQSQRGQFRYFGIKRENIIKVLFYLLPEKTISCITDKKASCIFTEKYQALKLHYRVRRW